MNDTVNNEDPIVQYLLVRRDLKKLKSYNDGAIIAQACHASTAILFQTLDDDITKNYLKNLDRMHKIVLGVDSANDLLHVHNLLDENQIKHYLWNEQPENIPTALAIKPYKRTDVEQYFKNYKLYR